MASLLNNASLLLNPAGSVIAYEEDKIFSVLPTNGTGDFTFTGGNGGTRVNQQGYIEVTPPYQPTTDRLNYPRITYQNGRGALLSEPQRTNVNTYSQAIIAANGYNLGGCSLTGNNAISPDGTQNATLFTETADSNYHRYTKYGTGTASTKVWTIFAKYKPGGREWLTMDAGPLVYFNIANGTLGNTASDIITQIEPYKDGWYRCTYIDPTSAVNLCYVGAATYNGDPGNYAGDGRDCFWVWGMQCEDGVSFPTSQPLHTSQQHSATVTRPIGGGGNSFHIITLMIYRLV
jgi:hypothetical protein